MSGYDRIYEANFVSTESHPPISIRGQYQCIAAQLLSKMTR